MLQGLMQDDFQLTLQHVLDRMRTLNSEAEVVTLRSDDGSRTRESFGEVADRVDRLAGALQAFGIQAGDRVATFAWNSQEHFELYMGIPCMGAVLHTLNIRLFPEQLAYVVNHAEDRIIFVDDSLVPLLARVADQLTGVELFVIIGDGDAGPLSPAVRYEDFLDVEPIARYPEIDERSAAGLCYTSGTTGNPKGVLYSHRSTTLHAMSTGMVESFGLSSRDRVLAIVPQFHANAWGLVQGASLIGASVIMPGRYLQAAPLAKLIEDEKVTCSGAVPTIWMDLLRYLDTNPGVDTSTLTNVVCGGAAIPRSLMQQLEERHAITLIHAWGMTETSPLGSTARPPEGVEGEELWSYRLSQGKVAPLVEARIIGEQDGSVMPWDGKSTGELQVRGPWIAKAYYGDPEGSAEKFQDGWLRTGDVASIDAKGYIRITDRTKDIIKSGGEWISSVELENELMGAPGVVEAAVISMPDERYSERPLGCVVVEGEQSVAALREHLSDRVAKWWIPDAFAFIDEVPKTSVGKFDKKVLRQRLADGELTVVSDVEHAAG